MIFRIGTIQVFIFVWLEFQENVLVLSACSGSGFPAAWTTTTPGVTYWYVTEAIKRQFTASYVMTDYYVYNGNVYGSPPTCESEYYDSSTGYYYYLMHYSSDNVYSTNKNIQICHAFKKYNSVIREYFHDLNAPGVLSDAANCVSYFTTSTRSLALSKYNFIYVDCPFSNEEYNFTFSNGGNSDYCSGQLSSAYIGYETISLKSCYDFSLVDKANPFYGAFACLSYWPAETRDTPANGDFIVVEMYDSVQWPYCGRYKVGTDGVITMSLYLSMSEDSWFPVFCDASQNNEYIYESGTTKYTRMIFTPTTPHTESPTTATDSTTSSSTTETTTETTTSASTTTTTTATMSTTLTTTTSTTSNTTTTSTATAGNATEVSSSDSSFWNKIKDLYWPWWILVACVFIIILSIFCCLLFACKRKKSTSTKVENIKQSNLDTERARIDKRNLEQKGQVQRINVKSIHTKPFDF